jgi:Tfp pilus assembly protein PilF
MPGQARIVMLVLAKQGLQRAVCLREGVSWVARRSAAVWAVLAVVFAAVLSLVVGLAVDAVPDSWGWAHNWWLLIGISAGLLAAAGLVAVAQTRSSADGAEDSHPVARAGTPRWSPVAGSNTGTMISARRVFIRTDLTADPGGGSSSPASTADRPGARGGRRPRGKLPSRNPAFTGREDMLAEIERQLAGGPVAVVAVRGLGGTGKSQVALEYAHRMRATGRYQVTAWVRADSAVTAAEDLAALAPLLGLGADGPAGEVAASVVTALGSRQDWLVMFDNAQGPGDLAGMLPGGGGHVLITSRNRAWSGVASQLDLEVFSRAESVAFVCRRSGRPEPEAAGELAAELGDLPLALAQAAAYIDARAVTIGGYLALYRDPVLARRLRDEGLDAGEYPASVARTWLLTIGQLSEDRPAAAELLRLCAFLGPDEIDLDVLAPGAAEAAGGLELAAALGDRLERTETAGALARASLLTVTAEDRLRVHRLVQAVTRDQLDGDQLAAWCGRVLDLVTAVFPGKPQDHRSWPVCASMASHVEAIAAHAGRYRNLAGKSARLLGRLGVYLCASAQSRVALKILERALAMEEAADGPGHHEAAVILNNLGIAQWELGDLAAARASIERALAIDEAAYGPGHPELATALNNLGAILGELGEVAAARASVERALAIDEAAYGPGHPEVANTLNNLGAVQRRLGELPAARATLEHALAIEEAAYGPDHPEVGDILSNLGIVQRQLSDLPAARASAERALAIKQAAYGHGHPDLASILNHLGAVQRELGEIPAARATLERALAIKQAAYGPHHPEVADILSNLDIVQQQLGNQR